MSGVIKKRHHESVFQKILNYLNGMAKSKVGNFTKAAVFQTFTHISSIYGTFVTLDKTLFRTFIYDTDREIP